MYDNAKYTCTIDDTVKTYDIRLSLRTSSEYPYRNIYLFMVTTFPSGTTVTDTLHAMVTDEKGHWLGKGTGNIRELKNCITRAMTFVDGDLLLAEHISLGQDRPFSSEPESEPPTNIVPSLNLPQPQQTVPAPVPDAIPATAPPEESSKEIPVQVVHASHDMVPANLNARQKKAWPAIVAANGTNRALYQSAIGDEISVRTAQYDLQDMVNKGLLIKSGKGPSSRYVVAGRFQ